MKQAVEQAVEQAVVVPHLQVKTKIQGTTLNMYESSQKIISLLQTPSWQPIKHFFNFLSIQQGEVLQRQGAPAKGLYVLTTGKVALSMQTAEKGSSVIAVLDGQGHFGEVALIDGANCLVTATALEPVNVIFMDAKYFQVLKIGFPNVAFELMSVMLHRAVTKLKSTLDGITDAITHSSPAIRSHFSLPVNECLSLSEGWPLQPITPKQLMSLPSFNVLTNQECERILNASKPLFAKAGQCVNQSGHRAMLLLVEGNVQLLHESNKVGLIFPPIKPGFMFSAERMINQSPLTSSLQIVDDAVFLAINELSLWNLRTTDIELYAKVFDMVMQSLAHKMRLVYEHLVMLAETYSLQLHHKSGI